jgi:hypothetical protein
VSQIQE